MNEFQLYFGIGKDHILDYQGYDHILFVIALSAVYLIRDWQRVLVLVTAFTIGHSITLALATLRIISVNTGIIEFLIPLTILITAASNIIQTKEPTGKGPVQLNYFYALFFGLIHGLGFSTLLRALLGKSQNITTPLLAFNLGLELGQIIIVTLFLGISYIVVDRLKANRRYWRVTVSAAAGIVALWLMKDRIFW